MAISQAEIRDSIWRTRLGQNEDVLLCHPTPAYIDENLFYEYICEVFIPYIVSLCGKTVFAIETAILFDGFSSSPPVRTGSEAVGGR
jgi:hypothetical protein